MQPVSEVPKSKQVWQRIKKHGPNVTHPVIAELLSRVKPWVEVLR